MHECVQMSNLEGPRTPRRCSHQDLQSPWQLMLVSSETASSTPLF
jgi:hypothetical protein